MALKSDFISLSKIETFYGMVETSADALRIFQLCREGRLGRVRRRLHDHERKQIRSGSVFVFNETESGIKRWTDGRLWSPSRIFGDFLIYRELEKKYARRTSIIDTGNNCHAPTKRTSDSFPSCGTGLFSKPTFVTSYHLISSSSTSSSSSSSSGSLSSPVNQKHGSYTADSSLIPENTVFPPTENSQIQVRSEILDTKFKSSFFSASSPIAITLTSNSSNSELIGEECVFGPTPYADNRRLHSEKSTEPFSCPLTSQSQLLSEVVLPTCSTATQTPNDAPKSLFIIREDGLIKKTLSMTIDGQLHHLVCYYSKSDFFLGKEAKNLPSVSPSDQVLDGELSEMTFSLSRFGQAFPQILPRTSSICSKKDATIKRKRRHSSNSITPDYSSIGTRRILPSNIYGKYFKHTKNGWNESK